MPEKTRGYAHRVDIEADCERVWRALTEVRCLARWCAPDAAVKPRPGGSFRAKVDRVSELEAMIDVFEPGRRLRLIHMPARGAPRVESAIVDDLLLEAASRCTVVRILGSGFPEGGPWDAYYLRLRAGWERALARLKVYLEKNMDLEVT
jgi:uncharacterized protein YndB with AHSA1/START domain